MAQEPILIGRGPKEIQEEIEATRSDLTDKLAIVTPSLARDWRKRSPALRWSSMSRMRPRGRTTVLAFFETSGRNLLAAEAAAGVGHHVALSVVGTDRLFASGYFRAKMAQEKLIKASPIPYSIVRATQFFEFVGGIAQSATEGQTVRVPPVLMQPIVSDDVAAVVVDVALAEPLNGTFDLAGPEPIRQDDLVRQFLNATGDGRTVIADPKALYYGITVNDQSLTPGDHPRLGPTRFEDWLSSRSMAVAR
jgi:uncharacterized protein YbjT (DUF2867 family)